MKKLLFTCLLLGFCFCLPALGAEFYIDAQNGSDGDAGTEAAPWQTLAMINSTNISSDDTVYLKGDFTPVATVTLDSTMQGTDFENHTTITNWPEESPTVKLDASFAANGNFHVQGNNYTISGIEFHNNSTYLASSYGIMIQSNQQYVNVEDCIFRDANYAIGSGASVKFITVTGNTLFDNWGAINIYSGENITITKNTVYNNTSRAIMILLTSTNNLIANNYVYDNTSAVGIYGGSITTNVAIINNVSHNNRFGFACEGYGTGIIVKNNIFSNNQVVGVFHIAEYPVVFDYNLYYNNAATGIEFIAASTTMNTYTLFADWQALGHDVHSSEGDPLFFNTTSGSEDFHITDASPAVDAGLDVSDWISDDYDSETRPYGGVFDIGADERPVLPILIGLSNTPKVKKSTLSWDGLSADYPVTEYVVTNWPKTDNTDLDINASSSTSLELTGLKQAKKYYGKVKAKYETGHDTYYSNETSDFLFSTKPKKVKKLKVIDTGKKWAKIRFKKYKRIKKYVVKLMNSKGKKIRLIKFKKKSKFVKNAKKKYVKKTIKNLKPGKKYKVKVRARKKFKGDWLKGKFSNKKVVQM
ncbi:MAG: right-handed parallel beta-helix repeat-containing protein [Patescibacteria group bacterium]